jgi:hypothetical protein
VTDFYVDKSADAGACAFATLGAAAAAASASTAPSRTIHLAAGTYSVATGESFPIVLRGISLVGAGESQTVLTGTGLWDVPIPTNATSWLTGTNMVVATLVVGDVTQVTISGLSLTQDSATMAGTEAIVCDRGTNGTSADPKVAVTHVTTDGFEIGLRVTWSSLPLSGCSVSVTSSSFKNGWFGIASDGAVDPTSRATRQGVAIQVGDGTPAGANTFLNMSVPPTAPLQAPAYSGAGISVADAVTAVVRGNRFLQDSTSIADMGILIEQGGPYHSPSGITIDGNEFGPLANAGVELSGTVVVDSLVGNSFHDISMQQLTGAGWLGVALEMDDSANQFFPVVTHARGNTFFGNDVGVAMRAYYAGSVPAGFLSDFGNATDSGGNTFRCNSAAAAVQPFGGGADVVTDMAQPQPMLVLPFEGNVWDHAPPTQTVGSPESAEPIGVDVFSVSMADAGLAVDPTIDVGHASTTDGGPPCPAGNVAGP